MSTPSSSPLETLAVWCQEHDLAPRTHVVYTRLAGDFLRWWAQQYPGRSSITARTPEIRTYLDWCRDHHCRPGYAASAATLNQHRAAVRALFEALVDAGACPANPVARVKAVRLGPPKPRWRSDGDLDRLRSALDRCALRDRVAAELMLSMGLRNSEVTALRWSDVSPTHLVVAQGKGRKSRKLPLPKPVAVILGQWRLETKPQDPMARLLPIHSSTLTRITARLAKAAGLRALTPHQLRHTWVHGLVANGVRLETVATLAGHESLETTRRYTEPSDEDLAAAMGALLHTR